MRTHRIYIYIVMAAILMGPAREVAAQGFNIVETGTRKNGMGAAIGRPDDASAVYHNPAGLTLQKGTHVFVSWTSVFLNTDIRLQPWSGANKYIKEKVDAEGYYPRTSPSTFAAIPMIVARTNLFSERLVGAASIYVPNAAGAKFDAPVARYHLIDSYIIAAFATLSAAYKVSDWLSVGGGVSLVYVKLFAKRMFFPEVKTQDMDKPVDLGYYLGGGSEMEMAGEDVVPAFNLGLLLTPFKELTIGFTVMTPYTVNIEGDVTLKFGEDARIKDTAKVDQWDGTQVTNADAPWILFMGANLDIFPWLEVGGELRYYFTSSVGDQVTKITGIELLETFGLNELVTPKNLRNYFQVSGGFMVKPRLNIPLKMELMAGVHYESASAPYNTITVEQPSFSHWGIHLGARLLFLKRYRVGLCYWHYEYLERNGRESLTIPPTNFQGSGNADAFTVTLEVMFSSGGIAYKP